jgi:hypothetical protein
MTTKAEVKSLLKSVENAGFTIIGANDGEGEINRADFTKNQFVEEIMATDECTIRLQLQQGGPIQTLYLVYGNEPGELVCDHTDTPELAAITDAHYDKYTK